MISRAAQPSASTPLIAMDVVVLDTETTGLDVRNDRILQIGAVRMHGAEIDQSRVFDVVLDPGIPVPEASRRVHGLTDADVRGKAAFPEVAASLAEFIGHCVVVGHSIHFDLAMLRHEAVRHKLRLHEPKAIDISLIAAGLDRGLVDTSLGSLALSLGIKIKGRHTALGDALATARIYAGFQQRLLASGIRTLGELENLCRRPTALIAQQENAGWYDSVSARPDFALAMRRTSGQRAIDSYLYRHRLSDVMSSPPVALGPEASLHDVARLMADQGIGCLIIDLGDGRHGILTERDLLQAMARDADVHSTTAGSVMSAPVMSAPGDMHLYRALGFMARHNLRYLGVEDADGDLAGVFTLRSLLRERALATLTVGDEIANATRPRELARVQAALPSLAAGLLSDGLDARAVAGIITAEARAMTARAAEIAELELATSGFGPPPADYALLVLGSAGRGESMLAPDQDNALVISDSYAGDLGSPDDWFTRFATRVNEILDRAGIPYCKGGVMAKNRPWRRRLGEWLTQAHQWAEHPRPEALLNVDIFYDFTPVHAPSQTGRHLAEILRTQTFEIARNSLSMLRALGETAGAHAPPLGLFGRIRKDEKGRVNLKSGGLLPIVAGARAIALRQGVTALSTPERLVQSAALSGRSESDAALLADIHGFLLSLILTQQIADIEAGIAPGNRVDLSRLSQPEQDHLKDGLSRIALIGDMLRDILEGLQ